MRFKLMVLLFITLVCSIQLKAQNSVSSTIENALAQAKIAQKNVFIKYTASWCGWCKKMDQNMNSDACTPLFEANYSIVNLVVNESKKKAHLELPGTLDMLKKHGGAKAGLPFWVILDPSGTVIADAFDRNGNNLGCPATEKEVEEFVRILKKTSNLTAKNLDIIAYTFLSK